MTTSSKRKPYQRKMPATWWKKLGFYKAYIVREATCIPTIWFCLILFYGIISLAKGDAGITSFTEFLSNPIVIILNVISLAALLYHAATLFVLTPQVLSLTVKGKRLNTNIVRYALWGATIFVSVLTLILVFI